MRWRVLVAAAASVIALTACTGSSTNQSGGLPISPPLPGPSSGVKGQLNYIGGPTGGPYLLEAGTVNFVPIQGGHGSVARFPQGKGFSIPLPPGTYRLIGKSGDAVCRSRTVKVLPGRYTTVTIVCGVM